MLIASLVFYAWGEPKFVIAMMASITINYMFGVIIAKMKDDPIASRVFLIIDIVINLSLLFVFKYLNFAISNIDNLFGEIIPRTAITLPIGISFFTFQAMSYVIDVYKGDVKEQRNPFYLGLYISLFPQLIAGPIVRYKDVEEQIDRRNITAESFGEGARRFIVGFNKKILLANNMAIVADWVFSLYGSGELTIANAWLGAICYTLQIYFDFGGYSDMAIGLGKMFGFNYMENFNYPYVSKSATEFWRRWHISLGTWFRDYVYIPLGGSRVNSGRHIFNLLVVWSLTGIWHGANWTFLIWGLLYFVLLAFEKKTNLLKDSERLTVNFGKHIYTLFFVIIGWVIFRSDNLICALTFIKAMLGFEANCVGSRKLIFYLHEYFPFMIFAIIYSTGIFKKIEAKLDNKNKQRTETLYRCGIDVASIILFLVSISYLVIGSYNPFIYFNF